MLCSQSLEFAALLYLLLGNALRCNVVAVLGLVLNFNNGNNKPVKRRGETVSPTTTYNVIAQWKETIIVGWDMCTISESGGNRTMEGNNMTLFRETIKLHVIQCRAYCQRARPPSNPGIIILSLECRQPIQNILNVCMPSSLAFCPPCSIIIICQGVCILRWLTVLRNTNNTEIIIVVIKELIIILK